MTRRLIIRPEAEAEMGEAFDWYEDHVPGLGAEFLMCLDAVFNGILRNPQQFPIVHQLARRALTRCISEMNAYAPMFDDPSHLT